MASKFAWEARTATGELQTGVMEAETADLVQSRLRSQKLSPVKVKKQSREINFAIGSPVTPKELVVFTRQFGTMIDAGLPLVQCLDILSNSSENKAFAKVLREVKSHVEQGGTFSEALGKHPKIFDELYVNLVAAGEMGGILDTILNRLAIYIEKRVKLARQVRGAMVYPLAVLGVAVLVIGVMLTWVIPSFQAMFADFGGEDALPALTKMVVGLSEWFTGNLILIFVAGAASVMGITYSMRTKRGRKFWDRLFLTFPIIGPVMRKISVARFTRTLGTLLGSGVPILEAMKIVGKAAGNVIIEEAIEQTAERVREGRTMAEPLMETKVFPSMVVQMIGVGEQTGALDQMLNKIADFYEDEVDVAVAALTSLLEPLMMVFIGGIVGVMLVAMYLPIFSIAGEIQTE